MSPGEATAALQKAEAAAFGPGGCCIAWTSSPMREAALPASTGSEAVYREDVCNCQARMVYQTSKLVQLVFRSAC